MAKSETRRIADEIIKKLNSMSQEDFERKVLKLNGTMTDELFEKVMKEVYRLQSIDDEGLSYGTVAADISVNEFSEVFYYIEEYARSRNIWQDEDTEATFPEYRLYFKHRGGEFIWRMIVGQGTALQIHAVNNENRLDFKADKAFEMLEVDTKIKYYKHDME